MGRFNESLDLPGTADPFAHPGYATTPSQPIHKPTIITDGRTKSNDGKPVGDASLDLGPLDVPTQPPVADQSPQSDAAEPDDQPTPQAVPAMPLPPRMVEIIRGGISSVERVPDSN
jgi:hypothetical protein